MDDRPAALQAELDALWARVETLAATPFDASTDHTISVLDARAHASEPALRAGDPACCMPPHAVTCCPATVGAAQQGLRLAALGDVDQRHHRPLHHAVLLDRVAGVFNVEGAAVGAPEQPVADAAGQALAEGLENRAVGLRVVAAVGMGVVDQRVHVAADDHIGRPAQHLRRVRHAIAPGSACLGRRC